MNDAYERRALLLHLGDVLETLSCLSRTRDRYKTLGEALLREDFLSEFTLLKQVGANVSPQRIIERATSAFFLWPKTLLDEELNRSLLASTVKHDLFASNAQGWNAYVEERRRDVAWFGEGLDNERLEPAAGFTRWPWPDDAA